MAKKLINLLIEVQPEPLAVRRFRRVIPTFSITLLVVYIVLQISLLAYIKLNLNEYNKIQKEVQRLENRIAIVKSRESLYITSIGVLDKIKKILDSDTKIISNTLPVLINIQSSDVFMDTITVDNNGPAGFTVKTSNVTVMENLVNELTKIQTNIKFKDVKAAGIIRENDGSYTFSVSLSVDKKT